jgi:hypothetical protein
MELLILLGTGGVNVCCCKIKGDVMIGSIAQVVALIVNFQQHQKEHILLCVC